jgi:3-dehydroquinate dehydratase-1
MNFNICAAIQIKSGKFSENRPILDKILRVKPNFVEFRFDYINNVQDVTQEFSTKLISYVKVSIPVIATFRKFSEGGKIELDRYERMKILKKLIAAQPNYLDLEMDTDPEILQEVIKLTTQFSVQLIFSYHDFEKTPSYDDALRIIENFNAKLESSVFENTCKREERIYKMIFNANNYQDNLIVLKLCRTLSKEGFKVICFCMGELGILSRIMCVKVGSFLTFGSIDEETAPGQINIVNMREIHELLFPD